ncbi:glycosyltransferase 87 family protein [Streptomyces sp. NPDC051211]|uniref:glycosyltransferase 87 family protein n=1 Tax=Streptomyces sp. NPDC051211 TaxID=3154643 RepID=UPI00344D1E3C
MLKLSSAWSATRILLLLCTFRVIPLPGADVTVDVTVIYQGWFGVLRTGTFPLDDVTWQYPPGAALAVLAPGLLPFLSYTAAFILLCLAADAVVTWLLARKGLRAAWYWVWAVPLVGPTAYARYDIFVAAVAVAALLLPRVRGPLIALGAVLKVWPALLLAGVRNRMVWLSAAATGALLLLLFAVAMPGSLAFLTFQRDRGTEVESLGALPLHFARAFGWWEGEVKLNYGSVEFLGPWVNTISTLSLGLTAVVFGWLLVWRLRARIRVGDERVVFDAAFAAVLLFTITSRVISPQYLVWLVALAAVCLTLADSKMVRATRILLVATAFTQLEFPTFFSQIVGSDWVGIVLIVIRNGLLVWATVSACRVLWAASRTAPEAEPEPLADPRPAAGVAVGR